MRLSKKGDKLLRDVIYACLKKLGKKLPCRSDIPKKIKLVGM